MITDTFDPVLSNISVTFNDTAWKETTNYTYDETTGLFATLAGEITVPETLEQVDEFLANNKF